MNGAKKQIAGAVVVFSAALVLSTCARDPQKAKAKYLAAGQGYMKKGQYGDAAIEFRNALRLDPRFVEAYYQLAQADLARHDWSAAYEYLEKAIELDPSRLDARLDRGRLYLAAREFDKAEDEANVILKQDSRYVAAYQLLGAALVGEQKPGQALAAFSRVIDLLPNNSSAYVNLALIEISLHRYDDAEQHFKKAVAVDPQSIQAYNDLANFYRLQNRVSEAEQVLRDGVAKNPEAVPLYLDWTSILASQGRVDDARVLLDKLRKQVPNSSDATVAIGDFYFQRKEKDQALAEYRRGLSAAPKNLDIEKRMENLYLSTSQGQLASDLDRELMKEAPKDVIVRVNHGRLLMLEGDPHQATIYLQKVVADAADSVEAHYYLAMAFWQNGDLRRAQSALLDALKASPNSPMVLQELARLSLEQRDAADAKIYAQELIRNFPADPADRQLLAEALAQQGQLRPAEEQFLIAKQLAPDDPIVHLNLAQVYFAEKKWPEAQREFDRALQLDPHNAEVLGQLADFLTARNQSANALARVQQFVSANPNDANGHVILGALNFESQNYSSARSEFERAIQLDPKHVQAYLRLGKVYEAEGQTDLAIVRYQKALDLQPKFAALATMVGNFYLNKGDLETARKYFGQALEADPNFAIANANLAWIDAEEGKNLDVALGRAQKAKSLMPESPAITDTLAWVLYKKGNYAGAAPLLQECVQKSPNAAEFRYHLGMTLMAAGQKSRGREELQTALRMRLGSSEAQQAQLALDRAN
jgi:tetratricopeptide (TPR) repeat protein